jgi:hypothetical protein
MKIVLLTLAFILSFLCSAQTENKTKGDSIKYSPKIIGLPVLFYSPETRLGFGAAGFFSFKFNGHDTLSRPSQINFGGAYTQEKQLLTYAEFDLWVRSNKFNLNGEVGYYRFFYYFWGVGEETRQEESFNVNFPRVRFEGYYELKNAFFIGPKYTYDYFDITSVDENGRLAQNSYPGTTGGGISGLGIASKYDTRNSNFYPTEGFNTTVSYEYFSKALGGDFDYHLAWVNFIKYIDLKKDRVLAANVYGRFTQGEVPFFHLSQMGGNSRMRGYYEGFHRDKQKIGWQAEYRTPVFWRVGMVFFAGNALVADAFSNLKSRNIRSAAGAGLRFKVDHERNINLRIDFGFTSDRTTGLYFTIGEAF